MLFAGYNAVAALAALALPGIAARIGELQTYALCLPCGAAGIAGFVILPDPDLLWLASLGTGFASGAELTLPQSNIVGAVMPRKAIVCLGIPHLFIVLPNPLAPLAL